MRRCWRSRQSIARPREPKPGREIFMSGFDRRVGMKLAAAACLSVVAYAYPAAAQDVLRFGLAMPLTGSQALYGQDQVKAAEWAVAEINKAGGIGGKKLEMIVLDTQADPQL